MNSTTSPEIARQRTRNLLDRAEAAIANPIVSYVAIVALQLRVIWNVWRYKDLTIGDTSEYFINAASWAHGLHESVIYSPLYAAIWGTILAVVHDVYAAAMIHRVAIILATTVLVLALMRSLLGPALGLLAAAWWAVVPANYDALYEAHLFGLLPILIALLIVARVPRRNGLGLALAVLLASAVLVRNELLVVGIIFALTIVVYEFRARRTQRLPISSYARAYGPPLLIACLLVGGAYWRSYVRGGDTWPALQAKEELNLCEAYAFNYQQRYPARVPGAAFTSCSPIMQHDFGRPMPTLLQATTANPRAMAGFMAWNTQLLPSGMQVALFGATSTADNPSYPPVEEHRPYALTLSILVLALLFVGFLALHRDRKFWRQEWLAPRGWPVVLLISVAIATLVVALTERPWAEYIYGLTVCVLAIVGLCLSALLRGVGVSRLLAPFAAGLILLLIIAMPSNYHPGPRPLHDAVERVQIIRRQLDRQGSVLVASELSDQICHYSAQSFNQYCSSIDWPTLRAQLAPSISVRRVLDRARVSAIYANAGMLSDPVIAGLLAGSRASGWRLVAAGTGTDGPWRVLVRTGASV